MSLCWSCSLGSVLCCANFLPPPHPTKFTVAGTALCPTSAVGVSAVSQDCRSPTPGPDVGAHSLDPGLAQPLVQAPAKPTASGHPLCSGVPQALCVQLCFPPLLWPVEADPLASAPEVGPASLPRRGTRPPPEPKVEGADVWMKRL